MHDMYLPAFLGLVVSGATDWVRFLASVWYNGINEGMEWKRNSLFCLMEWNDNLNFFFIDKKTVSFNQVIYTVELES